MSNDIENTSEQRRHFSNNVILSE